MARPSDGKTHRKHAAHPKAEDHASIDAPFWFISWADLVTLLFGLFVALFSISTMSEEKLKGFLQGIRGYWGQGEGQDALQAMRSGKTQIVAQSRGAYFKGDKSHPGPALEETLIAGKDRATKDLRPGSKLVRGARIEFDKGSSSLGGNAQKLILEAAAALRGYRTKVEVRGYSEGGETSSASLADAWDLAYARAKCVSDLLVQPAGGNLLPHRIKIVVGGPVDPISLDKEVNRRVEVVETKEFTYFPWQNSHWLHQRWLTEQRKSPNEQVYYRRDTEKLRKVKVGMFPKETEETAGAPQERQQYSFGEDSFEEWKFAGGTVRFFVHKSGELGTVIAVGVGKGWRFTE